MVILKPGDEWSVQMTRECCKAEWSYEHEPLGVLHVRSSMPLVAMSPLAVVFALDMVIQVTRVTGSSKWWPFSESYITIVRHVPVI